MFLCLLGIIYLHLDLVSGALNCYAFFLTANGLHKEISFFSGLDGHPQMTSFLLKKMNNLEWTRYYEI